MALATLSIDIEAKLANLEAGMDKAARLAEKNAAHTEAAWARAGARLAAIGALAAGALGGFSLIAFVKGNAEAIDALNDLKDATGSSIEKLSGLDDLSRRTGGSLQTVEHAIVKLNQALIAARPNTPIEAAFKQLGLSVEELKRLDPVDALQATAKAMSGYAEDGDRARAMQLIFTESVAKVVPLLNDVAEAGKLNSKITAEQAAEAEKFNKQLFALQANAENAARSMASSLIPVLNQLFDRVKEKGVGGSILDALGFDDKFFETKAIADAGAKLRSLQRERETLTEQLRADYTNADTPQRSNRLRQIVEIELPYEIAAYKKAVNDIKGIKFDSPAGAGRGVVNPPLVKPGIGPIPDRADPGKKDGIDRDAQALQRYLQLLQDEIDKHSALTSQELVLRELRKFGSAGASEAAKTEALSLDRKLTLLKQEEAIRKNIAENIARDEAALKSLDDALDQFAGRTADALKRVQTARLEARIASGESFTPEELEKIVNGIGGISATYKQKLDEMDELTKQFGRNVQDALGQTVKATLKGDFDNIGQLWGNLLLDMASQAIAMNLGKSLFGDFFKGGSLGGTFGDIAALFGFGFANGGAFERGGQVTAFASGGVFDQPTPFGYGAGQRGVLGEAGPEGVLPLKRGADGKLGVISSGSAGGLVFAPVTTISVDSRADRGAVMAELQNVMAENNKAMLSMLRAKGAI